ncbi:MAG: interleukin-like EMT inducer domain-containing protein, partial [Anaerolineae bacterium]
GAGWLLGRIAGRRSQVVGRRLAGGSPVAGLALCILAAGILLEHLAVPLPTTDARVPEIYRMIAAEPGEFAVMQLPLGWRNSFGVLGSEQTNLQYFQTVHGKPMIGGNISRAPAYKMAYFGRIPLFKALTALEMYRPVDAQTDAAARATAADLMALYNVRYFITTPAIPGRYPYQDTVGRTEAYALEVLPLEKPAFWEGDGYKAYRVIQKPVRLPFRVDVGVPGAEPYLGGGWDVRTDEQPYNATANWIVGRAAELYLPLDAPRAVALRLAIAPLDYPAAAQQKLSIRVNDAIILRDHALAAGWQTVTATVPAAATRRGPNRIRLELAWAASPRRAFPDPASRAVIGRTGVVSPVNLEAHAFSEAFISAFTADGQEIKASSSRRGYNVAVFDPRSGRLLDQRGFDTAANAYEADALAAYLSAIPQGRIVVLATKGDAAAHLTPAAADALRRLGSQISSVADLAGRAHALIGVQGAAPAAAAEDIRPADAFVRVAGDFRTLAAAVDWVEWGE